MIVGIGNDLVEINRIKQIVERYPTRFINKLLSEEERQLMPTHSSLSFIAGRWAAKEAFTKALGTGLRAPIHWQGISVEKDNLGKPILRFSSKVMQYLDERGINNCHVTISHDRHYAIAAVVLEA